MKMDKKPEFTGKRYRDLVPDTYDLAERAALALKAACSCIDADKHHWMWFTVHYGAKLPSMRHNFSDVDCAGKLLDALTMLCHMTGDTENQEKYRGFLQGVFDYIEDDRLFWVGRLEEDRPWAVVYGFDPQDYSQKESDEDVARIQMTSKMEQTCLSLYQCTGDAYWLHLAEEVQQAVDELTIRKEDYAYIPVTSGTTLPCGVTRSRKGWFGAPESEGPVEGHEGTNMDALGFQLKSAAMMYQATGSALSKDLADRWAKYLMNPKFWGKAAVYKDHLDFEATEEEPVCIAGEEQGHWYLHHHSSLRGIRAILDYGIATNDSVAVEFARRAFEYSWTMGVPRLGWVTEHPTIACEMEGCSIGDLVALAIRLCDAGAGDYWDQADSIIRNMLAENQYTKPDVMARISENAVTELSGTRECGRVREGKEIIDETVGLFFSIVDPDGAEMEKSGCGQIMFCCVINCMQALYYAWEAAVREEGDTACVNLLFNRAARGLDVYSYLPYEGKVEIRNKGKKQICVRVPGWTDKKSITLTVDDKVRHAVMAGQYIVISGLEGNEFITVCFDVPRYEAAYTVKARTPKEKKYTLQFRGSNAVDISPRNESPTFYPFFTDEALRTATEVPKKEVTRFVPDNDLKIW